MTIDRTKLLTLGGLDKFKTRQDAANALAFLKRSNIVMDGNEIAITKTEAATGVDAVVLKALTSSSAISDSQLSTVSASKISGVLSIDNIPAAAVERVVPVANAAARKALTSSSVQLGDVVHERDTGFMWFVVDTSKLNSDDGYLKFTAGAAASVPWSGVTDKPESYTPSSHTHGNISNDGKIGSTANLPIITGTNGVLQAGSFGNSANTFCEGNDSRLSDSRDPNDHASNKVTAMTGYSKASSAAAIGTSDSLNVAMGKVEYKLDDAISNAGDMGSYAKALSSSAIGTSDSIVTAIGKLEKKADDTAANAGNMSSYSKGSVADVTTSDTVVSAIGKIEAKVDNIATDAEIAEEIFGITA